MLSLHRAVYASRPICLRLNKMPRYIFIDSTTGRYAGDTQEFAPGESFEGPVDAAQAMERATVDAKVHGCHEVGRRYPKAFYDVYTAAPGFQFTTRLDDSPQSNPAYWVKRECQYVTTLARG